MEWSVKEFNHLGVDLKGRTSGQIKTTCPHCSHTRKKKSDPCLSVDVATGVYTCYNCNATGNIHKFKKEEEKSYIKPEWKNKTDLSVNVVKYFEGRGISQDTMKAMSISEGKAYMPQVSKDVNTIQFPYIENGEVVNVKYRDGAKNFKLTSGAKLVFYNIDSIATGDYVIVTEGEFDALSWIECGYHHTISVPNGANKRLDYLDVDQFDGKKIYLATDNDEKGIELRNELVRRLGDENCLLIDFGKYKDSNEYMVKCGKHEMKLLFNSAVDVPLEGIVIVNDKLQELVNLYEKGLPPGEYLRHSKLNELISWEKKRLAIFTGIPSHGKSEAVDEVCENLNTLHGWKSAFFSPENQPLEIHMAKIMAKLTGKWMNHLDIETLDWAASYMNDCFFWIQPDNEEYTLDNILGRAEVLVRRKGIDILVIDPWNTIEHQRPRNMTESEYVGKVLGRLANFAIRNDLLIFLVAHPTKMEKNSDGKWDVPNLYKISGSAHFYNKADYGVTIYRDEDKDLVTWYVQKVKFRHLGHAGFVEMENNHNNGRYNEFVEGMPSMSPRDDKNHIG